MENSMNSRNDFRQGRAACGNHRYSLIQIPDTQITHFSPSASSRIVVNISSRLCGCNWCPTSFYLFGWCSYDRIWFLRPY
jgi:hypothetical protein